MIGGATPKLRIVSKAPVRVGVIGCGFVANYGHIPAIDRQPHAELVAFCDPSEASRTRQAKRYGKPAFATVEAMLERVELDAVTIATHPDIRPALIETVAARGLHVLSEKPLCRTPEEAESITALMERDGLLLGMAFIYRGKPVVQRMCTLLREGAIGRLRSVMIDNLWDYHGLRSEAEATRRRRALENLGTLDCGVHDLDLVRFFGGGDFAEIRASGVIVEPENRYPDHLGVQGYLCNGVHFCLQESGVWGHTAAERPRYFQSYRLLGDNGLMVARLDFGGREPVQLQIVSGEKEWVEAESEKKAWDATYSQFYDRVLGRTTDAPFLATGEDALANMRAASTVVQQCLAAQPDVVAATPRSAG